MLYVEEDLSVHLNISNSFESDFMLTNLSRKEEFILEQLIYTPGLSVVG